MVISAISLGGEQMRKFIEPERDQLLLLANVSLDSVAPVGSAVRTIDELVERLDTSAIEMTSDMEAEKGQEPLHPKTLIKVALFALHSCRFSLRKMERDTELNLAYRWLTGDRKIDHSTMGKFLSVHRNTIVELFSQTVLICKEHGLIDFEVLAIDSMKVRANASYKQNKNKKGIEKEREKIEEKLESLFKEATESEESEAEKAALENRKRRLEAAAGELERRIEEKSEGRSEKYRDKVEKKEKINLTDPQARTMQQRNGEKNPSYSVTTTTDTKSDIITHIQVNEEDNDGAALLPAIGGSETQSGKRHNLVLADPAFSSIDNLEKLEEECIEALIPDKKMEAEEEGRLSRGAYDRSKFTYQPDEDRYVCPAGKRLEKYGEVTISGRRQNRYANREACARCERRAACARGEARVITRDQNEEIKERMRSKLKEEGKKELYKKRAHSSEAPYGQIKHNLKFRQVMRRGIEKARMEMALLGMLHNGLKIGEVPT
jgi:transposase